MHRTARERERERVTPREHGGETPGGRDTLLIKTIDLSPGLRMHLEINTRGRAHTLERVFPAPSAAHVPMIISLALRHLTLAYLCYSLSTKNLDAF